MSKPLHVRGKAAYSISNQLRHTCACSFEARAAERAAAKAKAEEEASIAAANAEELARSLSGASVRPNPAAETTSVAKSKKTADDDADLDAYLMGALGSDDEAGGTLQTHIPFFFQNVL